MKVLLFEKSHDTRDMLIKSFRETNSSILLDIMEKYSHLTNKIIKDDYDIIALGVST